VMCINCSQIAPAVRSVSKRTWMLVAMSFMYYGASAAAAGRWQIGCACT
jgi:hypothetical protein